MLPQILQEPTTHLRTPARSRRPFLRLRYRNTTRMPAKRRFIGPSQRLTSFANMRTVHHAPTDVKKIDVNLSTYVGFSMFPTRKHPTEACTRQYSRLRHRSRANIRQGQGHAGRRPRRAARSASLATFGAWSQRSVIRTSTRQGRQHQAAPVPTLCREPPRKMRKRGNRFFAPILLSLFDESAARLRSQQKGGAQRAPPIRKRCSERMPPLSGALPDQYLS